MQKLSSQQLPFHSHHRPVGGLEAMLGELERGETPGMERGRQEGAVILYTKA